MLIKLGIPKHLLVLTYAQVRKPQSREMEMVKWTGSRLAKEFTRLLILSLYIQLYTEYTLKETRLEEDECGGRNNNNLNDPNDITVIGENAKDLQTLVRKVKEQL